VLRARNLSPKKFYCKKYFETQKGRLADSLRRGTTLGCVAKIIFERGNVPSTFMLSGDPEQCGDEGHLTLRIALPYSFELTLPHHVHGFDAFERALRRVKALQAL
jgi:hypothetical protein